ncbi:hypothetical protein B0J13DRAFT_628258 [Dactylonectria estremocensis]|uniref:Uncharacterized protein n=1 Tax=Dactylonectria estremocensis TaxID=1079267 RepID=A0A9P9DT78_9HYPO|nr:hypothetical protein B0J13DRAFT_628258 [Dactylonectria estremocensis]
MAQATTNSWKAEAPQTPETDDVEMVGFLDAPLNREPALVDQTSEAFTNDDPETDSPRPADRGETPTKVPLYGFRAFLDGLIAVVVIFLPWTTSMVLCWMPITRIPLRKAPSTVLVSIVASTIERNPPSTGCLKKRLERASHLLFFFLSVSPIVTGAYVWFKARKINCDDGDNSLQCRVGPRFMLAIALFRILGIGGLFWGGMLLLVLFGNNFVVGGSQV